MIKSLLTLNGKNPWLFALTAGVSASALIAASPASATDARTLLDNTATPTPSPAALAMASDAIDGISAPQQVALTKSIVGEVLSTDMAMPTISGIIKDHSHKDVKVKASSNPYVIAVNLNEKQVKVSEEFNIYFADGHYQFFPKNSDTQNNANAHVVAVDYDTRSDSLHFEIRDLLGKGSGVFYDVTNAHGLKGMPTVATMRIADTQTEDLSAQSDIDLVKIGADVAETLNESVQVFSRKKNRTGPIHAPIYTADNGVLVPAERVEWATNRYEERFGGAYLVQTADYYAAPKQAPKVTLIAAAQAQPASSASALYSEPTNRLGAEVIRASYQVPVAKNVMPQQQSGGRPVVQPPSRGVTPAASDAAQTPQAQPQPVVGAAAQIEAPAYVATPAPKAAVVSLDAQRQALIAKYSHPISVDEADEKAEGAKIPLGAYVVETTPAQPDVLTTPLGQQSATLVRAVSGKTGKTAKARAMPAAHPINTSTATQTPHDTKGKGNPTAASTATAPATANNATVNSNSSVAASGGEESLAEGKGLLGAAASSSSASPAAANKANPAKAKKTAKEKAWLAEKFIHDTKILAGTLATLAGLTFAGPSVLGRITGITRLGKPSQPLNETPVESEVNETPYQRRKRALRSELEKMAGYVNNAFGIAEIGSFGHMISYEEPAETLLAEPAASKGVDPLSLVPDDYIPGLTRSGQVVPQDPRVIAANAEAYVANSAYTTIAGMAESEDAFAAATAAYNAAHRNNASVSSDTAVTTQAETGNADSGAATKTNGRRHSKPVAMLKVGGPGEMLGVGQTEDGGDVLQRRQNEPVRLDVPSFYDASATWNTISQNVEAGGIKSRLDRIFAEHTADKAYFSDPDFADTRRDAFDRATAHLTSEDWNEIATASSDLELLENLPTGFYPPVMAAAIDSLKRQEAASQPAAAPALTGSINGQTPDEFIAGRLGNYTAPSKPEQSPESRIAEILARARGSYPAEVKFFNPDEQRAVLSANEQLPIYIPVLVDGLVPSMPAEFTQGPGKMKSGKVSRRKYVKEDIFVDPAQKLAAVIDLWNGGKSNPQLLGSNNVYALSAPVAGAISVEPPEDDPEPDGPPNGPGRKGVMVGNEVPVIGGDVRAAMLAGATAGSASATSAQNDADSVVALRAQWKAARKAVTARNKQAEGSVEYIAANESLKAAVALMEGHLKAVMDLDPELGFKAARYIVNKGAVDQNAILEMIYSHVGKLTDSKLYAQAIKFLVKNADKGSDLHVAAKAEAQGSELPQARSQNASAPLATLIAA